MTFCVRFANVVRSADWIALDYAIINGWATGSITLGAEQSAGGGRGLFRRANLDGLGGWRFIFRKPLGGIGENIMPDTIESLKSPNSPT